MILAGFLSDWASLMVQIVKNLPAKQEAEFNPCMVKDREALAGYSPWGSKESNMTD